MSPEQFCYWLQGLLEVGNPKELNETQIKIIKDHLSLVFNKVTPTRSDYLEDELMKAIEDMQKKEVSDFPKPPVVTCNDTKICSNNSFSVGGTGLADADLLHPKYSREC